MNTTPETNIRTASNAYRRVASIQIMVIFILLTMGDVLNAINIPAPDKWVNSILIALAGVYMMLLVRLAKTLQQNAMRLAIMKVAIGIVFILALVALNPVVTITTNTSPWLISVHVILCLVECYLIALGLIDIYSRNIPITERLWGSVAVYLMIVLGWASFYEVMLICNSSALGPQLIPGYQTYSESLYFSMCALSGTSSVYTNPTHILRNLSLIEGVWGVLYLVMLIGRLFTLSDKEN